MTNRPFKEALLELLEERDMSQRELIRRTRKKGWGSTGALSNILASDRAPSVQAMEKIARALEVRPEHFPEYRLAKARTCLDPDVVGLKAALNGLGAAEHALDGK